MAENYPYSELEKVYETTLVDMVGRHFESDPKVAWQHAAAMEQFVRTSRPKAEFAAAMAKGVETEFDRARTDPDYRESEGFQRVLNGRVKRAERLATAIFAGRFDVYQRKIAYPDSLTRDLFPMAEGLGRDTDEIVAWIVGEIPLETYRQQPQHMGIQDGDRVFEFRSSELIWQQGLGNRGILLVRGNKIVGVQTFTSN